MPLSDVAIAITSLWRHGYLRSCLNGIVKNLPEVVVMVADDSDTDLCAKIVGNTCIRLSHDAGLSAKRNAIVRSCQKPLLLLACDDFDFSTPEARLGVEKLARVLDENPEVDVAGGRVDGRAYEGFLEYVPGEHIRELPFLSDNSEKSKLFYPVDLTVNYFLARVDTIKAFPWPEEMRIGGEHVCFFLDLKQAGKRVVWVPGVNVNTFHLPPTPDVQDPRYYGFRRRAISLGHPLMKKRYNITKYIGFDGGVS